MLSLDLWWSRDLNPPGSTNAPRYITRTRSIQSTWCSTNVSMAPDLQSLRRKICLSSWSCLCTGRMWVRTHAYRRLVWNCAYQLLLPESTWIYDWKLVKDRTIVSVRVPNRLIEAKFKSFSWASLCSTAVLCQEFHDHWLVRPKISNLIYRMALHTSENSCPKASRRCSWGELNAIGCVWCRRPWDTANIDFFIGSILRVIILFFRQTDTFSWFSTCSIAVRGSTREESRRFRTLVQIHQLEERARATVGSQQDGPVHSAQRYLDIFFIFVHPWIYPCCHSSEYYFWYDCVVYYYSIQQHDICMTLLLFIDVYCAYTVTICYFIVMFGISFFYCSYYYIIIEFLFFCITLYILYIHWYYIHNNSYVFC